MNQKVNQTTGFVSSIQKKGVFFISMLILFLLLPFKSFGQTDGDYRSLKSGGGWASPGTWEVYFASHDIWVSTTTSAWAASTAYNVGNVRTNGGNLYEVVTAGTSAASGGPTGTGTGIVDGTVTWDYLGVPPALAPSATTNVYIQDGVAQTSNGNGYVAGSITVGQGNAFSGTAVLTGNAVTSVTINNSGALMSAPGLTFLGAGTTQATGTVTFKMAGAFYRNKGAGYTTATVTVGTAWAAKAAVTVSTQRTYGGNLYTCTTAGTTSALGGPTGTGTGIIDSTVVWNYAGTAPTAHATIDAGKISGIVVDNAGGGYLTFPTLSITGDGAGAVYAIQMGIDNITISNGGNYTVAPQVVYGSYFMVGNNSNTRTVTVSGDVTFKNGSNLVSGGGTSNLTETLNIGGNLTAESPISFITVVPASTSSTSVNFTKAGTATISGTGAFTFQNLNIGSTTTLVNNGTITTISGTTNYHDILSFDFTTPAATGTVDATNHAVTIALPGGTPLTALVPTIGLRTGTTVSPASGVAQDFTNPVTYTTTAPGGIATQAWTVTVTAPSTDATLSALTVSAGTLSPVFASGTTAYNVVLPYGTTTVPTISATVNESHATTVVTQAASVTGSGTVVVTAQDGTTTQAYTVTFSVVAASTDATLSALIVSAGTLSPVFAAGTTSYTVALPAETTTIPTVSATANESHATVTVTQAATLTGSASVLVTAQDGTTTTTYTVNFSLAAPAAPVASAATSITKTSLSANWAASTGATGYYLDVATDNAFTSFVTGFNNKDVANVTTFSVTGLTTATTYYYRVRAYNAGGTSASSNTITALSLGTAVPSLSADELTIAVSANAVDIESSNNTIIAVQVVNVNGKQVAEKNVNSTSATISTDGWSSGMYVFIIKTQDQVITKKLGIVK